MHPKEKLESLRTTMDFDNFLVIYELNFEVCIKSTIITLLFNYL